MVINNRMSSHLDSSTTFYIMEVKIITEVIKVLFKNLVKYS